MKNLNSSLFLIALFALGYGTVDAQSEMPKAKKDAAELQNEESAEGLNTYLIERNIPDAGKFTGDQLKGISQKSCSVLDAMPSSDIKWLHSYVTEDKIYCVYMAKNKELIREHAEKGGFPADKITKLSTVISPNTAK